MIVSEITSGLGNQMFQYAAGRSLSVKNKTSLFLDIEYFKNTETTEFRTARLFELDIFNTKYKISNDKIIKTFYPAGLFYKLFNKVILKSKIYSELDFNFDKSFFMQKGNIFLKGYRQSEKYFKHIAEFIKEDFKFIKTKSELTLSVSKDISGCNAVSIHIRRGDYVSSPAAASFHGVLRHQYYHEAMLIIEKQIDNPVYYIFSDDNNWVREYFVKGKQNIKFIDFNNGSDSWQDMFLMSKCKHNIIANSSFSWWGAWLNENADKIVIAPKIWFADKQMNSQTNDLYPKGWVDI